MRNEKNAFVKIFVKMIVAASIAALGTCALFAGGVHAESIADESSVNVWYETVKGFRDAFAVVGVIGFLLFVRKKLQGAKGERSGTLRSDEEPSLRRNSVDNHADVNLALSSNRDAGCRNDDAERILCDIAELSDELLDASPSSDYALDRIDEILQRYGAMPITGSAKYDPRFHKAIPTGVVEKGAPIIDTLRNGWMLNGRVLRRARVKVAK